MVNRRLQIRQSVAAKLKEYFPEIGVFPSRVIAYEGLELPCLMVAIDSEENEVTSQVGPETKKQATLVIEVLVKPDQTEGDPVDQLDAITQAIENALHADESFGGLIDRCVLKSTDIELIRESEESHAFARMQYEVIYFSRYESSSGLSDFTGTTLRINPRGVA